jgi:uncharacterized protein (TIGR02001 family)
MFHLKSKLILLLSVIFSMSLLGRANSAFAATTKSSTSTSSTGTLKLDKKKATTDEDSDDDDEDNDDNVDNDDEQSDSSAVHTSNHSQQVKKTVKKSDDKNDDETDEDSDNDEDLAAQGKAITGNVTLASDYILRGLSQTDHNPAVQGGFDWEHPLGFYLGLWGSNVHFQDLPESLELDGYGGYTFHFAERTSLSVGALYYSYWADGDRNSWMIPVKALWKGFSLEADYSPRWEGQNTQALYIQGGWQDKVIWDVKLGAFVGYSIFTAAGDPDYVDGLISASREFFGVEWQISGVFVNSTVINSAEAGSRAVFSVTKEL